MPADRPLGVFKFGERRYIEQFADGLLYMNPLGYFVKLEADSVRGDPHEGTNHMAQAHGWRLQIQVEDKFRDVGTIEGAVRHQTPSDLDANLFCIYALRVSAADTLVDPRNQAFGDTFVVLIQFDEFMRTLASPIKASFALRCYPASASPTNSGSATFPIF